MIPVAPDLMVTFSPITTSLFEIVTIPTLILLLSPSIVTDASPIVRIPVTLASPFTKSVVFPVPIWTVPIPVLNVEIPTALTPPAKTLIPFLAVTTPTESILVTSS